MDVWGVVGGRLTTQGSVRMMREMGDRGYMEAVSKRLVEKRRHECGEGAGRQGSLGYGCLGWRGRETEDGWEQWVQGIGIAET